MRSNQSTRFKSWEVLLMGFSILLLAGSAFVYFSNISLRKYLLGMDDSPNFGEQVGELGKADGKVRRQSKTDAQFDLLNTKSSLYLDDTIMTGPESTATIDLESGGTLELSPNSMIRLNFESTLSMDGVSRVPVVQVLMGNVEAKALSQDIKVAKLNEPARIIKATTTEAPLDRPKSVKPVSSPEESTLAPAIPPGSMPVGPDGAILPFPVGASSPSPEPVPSPIPDPSLSPSPSPSPSLKPPVKTRIVQVSPAQKAKLKLPDNTIDRQLGVELKWNVKPDQPLELVVSDKNGQIHKETVLSKNGTARTQVIVKAPGTYQWELNSPAGPWPEEEKYISSFSLSPDFIGIEILSPLVGGEESTSNKFKGKHIADFDVTLRWKPYADVKKYNIRITNKAHKVLIEKEVEGSSYSFNKNKIYREEILYTVSSKLPDGFVVKSKEDGFLFQFQSPQQTYPFDGTSVSAAARAKGQQQPGTLFTWQKTNFTESYEFEISSEPTFTKDVRVEKSNANFIVIKGLTPGTYYWRTRSITGIIKSPPRAAFQITITP